MVYDIGMWTPTSSSPNISNNYITVPQCYWVSWILTTDPPPALGSLWYWYSTLHQASWIGSQSMVRLFPSCKTESCSKSTSLLDHNKPMQSNRMQQERYLSLQIFGWTANTTLTLPSQRIESPLRVDHSRWKCPLLPSISSLPCTLPRPWLSLSWSSWIMPR